MKPKALSRRKFLTLTGAAVASLSSPISFSTPQAKGSGVLKQLAGHTSRSLSLHNLHTGESIVATFWENGQYIQEALQNINSVLRDHRQNLSKEMDIQLLNQLFALKQNLGTEESFHVISGYRSQKTNEQLRKNSNEVAKRSYHTRGKAIDIRVPKIALPTIHKAALSLEAGGVGYYPKSSFIHLDTGPKRSW